MDKMLFEPLTLREVRLKNRIVVSPMLTYQGNAGHVSDSHLVHLGKMAAGGAGLVFMESTKVDPRGCSTLRDLGLWKDDFVPALKRITGLVKELGATPGIQLSHSGRKARCALPWQGRSPIRQERTVDGARAWELVSSSPIAHAGQYDMPRAMTQADIDEVVAAWGEAAMRANEAGFEVVEIHAAHGYLIHQFLSPGANKRTDQYGGSFENRLRFALEVVQSVRRSWPAHKPLFVRISATDTLGWTLEDSVGLAKALKQEGVDIVDCSDGGFEELRTAKSSPVKATYGYQVDFAQTIRQATPIPTMAVGLIVHAVQAERILARGAADLVALGREMLHNPNWPLDAAQKFGYPPSAAGIPEQYGYWLDKRARAAAIVPSTWTAGDETVDIPPSAT